MIVQSNNNLERILKNNSKRIVNQNKEINLNKNLANMGKVAETLSIKVNQANL